MARVPSSIEALTAALKNARDYTHAIYRDLPPTFWQACGVPALAIINPPIWEFGHVAWFAEYFGLRAGTGLSQSASPRADALYDSRHVAHASRWRLDYPSYTDTLAYMDASLTQVLAALSISAPHDRYRFQLVLVHELMHAESLLMSLRTWGLPLPRDFVSSASAATARAGDIPLNGGALLMGAVDGRSFQFDNEKPSPRLVLEPFSISSSVVSACEWASFCESADYNNQRHWSDAGWAWRSTREAAPTHTSHAAMHVNFYEAKAYCHAANRRLPTEAEWEFAATTSPDFAASTGEVWEWTASVFTPFAGFVADIYDEYSAPWFHTHQVLKGGSFATQPALKYPQYRNFFTPDRRDMFAGFRTCKLR